MLRRQGSVESGGLRRIYRRSPAASLPAARRVCACVGTPLSRVSGSAHPLTTRSGTCVAVARQVSPSCSESWLSPVNASLFSFPRYPGHGGGGEKSHENPVLATLLPHPLPLDGIERHAREGQPTVSPLLFISTPSLGCSSGFCSFQEIVIHRACFFAKCNYQRPCVYG